MARGKNIPYAVLSMLYTLHIGKIDELIGNFAVEKYISKQD